MKFKVVFYEMTNGEVPVENFMQSLDIKMRAKIYRNDYIERCEKDENI